MKKLIMKLSALALLATGCQLSSTTDAAMQRKINELREELDNAYKTLDRKSRTIRRQSDIILEQQEELNRLLEDRDVMSLKLTGTSQGPPGTDDLEGRVSKPGAFNPFIIESVPPVRKVVAKEEAEEEHLDIQQENTRWSRNVTMQPLAARPCIDDLDGQKREWAQNIYNELLSGNTRVDIDPYFFRVDTDGLKGPVAEEIEKAVYFSLYPTASYFNNGMVYSHSYYTKAANGDYLSYTLYMKDYQPGYLSIIDTFLDMASSGITGNTTEKDAYQIIHDTVCNYLTYDSSTVDDPLVTVIQTGKGVCNDYAEMVCSLCRYVGIDAKYVIGYDHGAFHAWVAVNLDGVWYYSDPTNDDQDYGIIRNFYLSSSLWDGYSIDRIV